MIKKKYLLYSDNPDKSIDIELLEDLFKKNINWEPYSSNDEKSVDFSYIVGKYKNIQTEISYRFNTTHREFLTNKYNLYKTIEREDTELYKNFMVKHYDINIDNLEKNKHIFSSGKLIIIRPTWAYERSGIMIFNNFQSFKNFMIKKGKYLYDNITKKKPDEKNTYVASEYIRNSLIYKNRVCDFRVFFLITFVNGIYRAYLVKPIVMNVSKSERKEFNITNITENITFAHGDKDYFMSDLKSQVGKENYKFMKNQIMHILSRLFKLIKKYKIMKKYEDQKDVYELFGLDFMSDDKYNIKLIEFNEKTGLGDYEDDLYQNIANAFIKSTINKKYDDNYKIDLDNVSKKNIIRIRTNKKYLD
jgi:hypothetical protein